MFRLVLYTVSGLILILCILIVLDIEFNYFGFSLLESLRTSNYTQDLVKNQNKPKPPPELQQSDEDRGQPGDSASYLEKYDQIAEDDNNARSEYIVSFVTDSTKRMVRTELISKGNIRVISSTENFTQYAIAPSTDYVAFLESRLYSPREGAPIFSDRIWLYSLQLDLLREVFRGPSYTENRVKKLTWSPTGRYLSLFYELDAFVLDCFDLEKITEIDGKEQQWVSSNQMLVKRKDEFVLVELDSLGNRHLNADAERIDMSNDRGNLAGNTNGEDSCWDDHFDYYEQFTKMIGPFNLENKTFVVRIRGVHRKDGREESVKSFQILDECDFIHYEKEYELKFGKEGFYAWYEVHPFVLEGSSGKALVLDYGVYPSAPGSGEDRHIFIEHEGALRPISIPISTDGFMEPLPSGNDSFSKKLLPGDVMLFKTWHVFFSIDLPVHINLGVLQHPTSKRIVPMPLKKYSDGLWAFKMNPHQARIRDEVEITFYHSPSGNQFKRIVVNQDSRVEFGAAYGEDVDSGKWRDNVDFPGY